MEPERRKLMEGMGTREIIDLLFALLNNEKEVKNALISFVTEKFDSKSIQNASNQQYVLFYLSLVC